MDEDIGRVMHLNNNFLSRCSVLYASFDEYYRRLQVRTHLLANDKIADPSLEGLKIDRFPWARGIDCRSPIPALSRLENLFYGVIMSRETYPMVLCFSQEEPLRPAKMNVRFVPLITNAGFFAPGKRRRIGESEL